jgi:hypothetical protein
MATMGGGHASLNEGVAGPAMLRMDATTLWKPGTFASGHLDCLKDSSAQGCQSLAGAGVGVGVAWAVLAVVVNWCFD